MEKTGIPFTKEEIQKQEEYVKVLAYAKENLHNVFLEAHSSYSQMMLKHHEAVVKLKEMKK